MVDAEVGTEVVVVALPFTVVVEVTAARFEAGEHGIGKASVQKSVCMIGVSVYLPLVEVVEGGAVKEALAVNVRVLPAESLRMIVEIT